MVAETPEQRQARMAKVWGESSEQKDKRAVQRKVSRLGWLARETSEETAARHR